ncbi:hypothetical protein [Xenorhabdus bovienii]|uniref:hypothetical protein n=1 Tax=Xenorhabdus bovienii TaxID=40576 RepID=UPI00237CE946|nr:hypothetical protein [Xenorhabdus bovienii]MDE1494496.1 hypothetical protein [Xenorhabdus bovienii]MDE9462584.1 hypothetical protein [Xenorhabdus bovienii]MDE9467974.1 hypothetical protein [Xenorhabdus bovienii]MDE9472638.1 hypothetical protein [Xenorhabdus bovienii]MDE9533735.1 hypothetical protein [Xenorhabdus bovienii]
MQPWQPGQQLLTNFDIKLGRLAASVKNTPCNQGDIARACNTADLIILSMMRQDHENKSRNYYT